MPPKVGEVAKMLFSCHSAASFPEPSSEEGWGFRHWATEHPLNS